MPQPKRQQQQQEAQDPAAAREAVDAQYVSYAEEAGGIWADAERLTPALFRKLEVLLRKPTPPTYIEVTPPTTGKPFVTTGLKSTQIQFDRMNDVLGAGHWRHLTYYTQQGSLAKTIVVVGNDLHWCRLDGAGELIPYTVVLVPDRPDAAVVKEAEVIAIREGWGGWKSRTLGDTFKASETNALKRTLARFGPGADVYRVDYEEDVITALKGEDPAATQFQDSAKGNAVQPQARPPQQRRQQPPPEPEPEPQPAPPVSPEQMTEEEASEALKELLEQEATMKVDGDTIDLKALRTAADEAMLAMPEDSRPSAVARYNLIDPRKDDPRQLADLATRAQNANG